MNQVQKLWDLKRKTFEGQKALYAKILRQFSITALRELDLSKGSEVEFTTLLPGQDPRSLIPDDTIFIQP